MIYKRGKNLISEKIGKAVKGLGGLYDIRITESDGSVTKLSCRAKGALKRDEDKVLIGDNVKVRIDDGTPDGVYITEILPRNNSLIRPPMANLDFLFIVFAAAKPTPVLETVDKLISIAEYNNISPVVIITKNDLAESMELYSVYSKAGIPTFVTSSVSGEGSEELKEFVHNNVKNGMTAAFAGASGVGKSTLLNYLFPELALATAEISKKIERGKHTTRHVELFEINGGEGFLADTPGFSLIDFARFDFFSLDDLFLTFREFVSYTGKCRYADCSHVGEGADDCAIIKAVSEGLISASRHESYCSIYKVLKEKNNYAK